MSCAPTLNYPSLLTSSCTSAGTCVRRSPLISGGGGRLNTCNSSRSCRSGVVPHPTSEWETSSSSETIEHLTIIGLWPESYRLTQDEMLWSELHCCNNRSRLPRLSCHQVPRDVWARSHHGLLASHSYVCIHSSLYPPCLIETSNIYHSFYCIYHSTYIQSPLTPTLIFHLCHAALHICT